MLDVASLRIRRRCVTVVVVGYHGKAFDRLAITSVLVPPITSARSTGVALA